MRELVNNLRKLTELYFKRSVLAENFIYERGLEFPASSKKAGAPLQQQRGMGH